MTIGVRSFAAAMVLVCSSVPRLAAEDWPQWRGPTSDSKTHDAAPPLTWGPNENVVWRTAVPGRGHSSPTVVADQIFLTTADEEAKTQLVLCYSRDTGKEQWRLTAFEGGFDEKAHKRNSQASCSVASNGRRVFATFMNDGAVWLLAIELEGKEIWRKRVGDFVSFWGYGASPTLHNGSVIVSADHSEGGYVVAYDQQSGDELWRQARPEIRNYTSPIILTTSGRQQLLMAGCDRIAAYDPTTGEPLWEADATTNECVGTIVADGDLAFGSGGYPELQTVAVRTDGSGEVVWSNRVKIYVPSMLAHDGRLFGFTDDGIAYCWDAPTGRVIWKKRLGGVFNASPVLVGDKVIVIREDGTGYVLDADAERFQSLAESKLGDEVYATPTFLGSHVYMRVAEFDGDDRREFLYCLGK